MAGRAAIPLQPDRESLIKLHLHWLNGAALAGSAVFFGRHPDYGFAAVAMMLFLPLLDEGWRTPVLPRRPRQFGVSAALLAAGIALLVWRPELAGFAASTLFFAALPEEWFFRAYFMTRIGDGLRSNLIASLLFALMHGLTRDWATAALVFVPSLFYGWLYQRTRDIVLVVLVHALSNLFYAAFIARIMPEW
jgi:membrane protease YdiL (CAAX protease family)